jgi:hypothetical protein
MPAAWWGDQADGAFGSAAVPPAFGLLPLCRCAERTAELILRLGWSAVHQAPPPPSRQNSCRGEAGEEPAEITTRIVRVIEVPRSELGMFTKTPEAQQVGVYFLLGELSESGLPRAYIGQSGNVGSRLVQHNQKMDFWNRAMVVISLTNSMTQTHALFLEWHAIVEAAAAGRYSLENGNNGVRPHTPAPLEADCREIHETAATLLATLGQRLARVEEFARQDPRGRGPHDPTVPVLAFATENVLDVTFFLRS